jgi:hypothetical protein
MGIRSLGFGGGNPDAQVHAEDGPGFTDGLADVLDTDGAKRRGLVLVS